jgi:hypothetical protein
MHSDNPTPPTTPPTFPSHPHGADAAAVDVHASNGHGAAHGAGGDASALPADAPAALKQWQWQPQPAGYALVKELLEGIVSRCPGAAVLGERMKNDTGTRLVDWVDTIQVPGSMELEDRLRATGFEHVPVLTARGDEPNDSREITPMAFVHRGAIFPTVMLHAEPVSRVAIKVDNVADFLAVWQIPHVQQIHGEPLGQIRNACAFKNAEGDAELVVVERHGYRGYSTEINHRQRSVAARWHLEQFNRRQRYFEHDSDGFAHANALIDAAIKDIGRDWTCDLFFESERQYWMRRNRAAQVQYARQQRLGLGWANHDHHTYRSSRGAFKHLIATFEKLGFHCRERFYAGPEAGWGAQVLEQPTAGITIFADVDMSPEELLGDFPHQGLPERQELGTIGLWCGLHGDAFLQAGMHHLECQFDWYALKAQLEAEAHIKTMEPFTTFPYLRQAFTEGERWPCDPGRLARLLERGQITQVQHDLFLRDGAVGSHLENLERNDGFKGFNQQGVSSIIARTDPRRLAELAAAGA